MDLSNYHTHSNFCDGRGGLEDYVVNAIERGIKYLGFSSHAPLPFPTTWTMEADNFPKYMRDIAFLKDKYKGKIELFAGLEIDYIAGISGAATESTKSRKLDYTIGSVHIIKYNSPEDFLVVTSATDAFKRNLARVLDGDINEAVALYYDCMCDMLQNSKPDIVAHFDLVKKVNNYETLFVPDGDWYFSHVMRALDALESSGVILEINTGGLVRMKSESLFPEEWIIKEAFRKGIPVTVDSDCHRPDQVAGYLEEAIRVIYEAGYRSFKRLTYDGWVDAVIE